MSILRKSFYRKSSSFSIIIVQFHDFTEKGTSLLQTTSLKTQTLTLTTLESRMIMIIDNTCVPGNDTATCLAPSSPVGLAVGLTFFFLLVVIVAGVIVYKYHRKMRNVLQFGQTRSPKNEDYRETSQEDSNHYTNMNRDQSSGEAPIYENLTARTAVHNRPVVNKRKSLPEPEEDVYLQCDSQDDAIYSNDVACNLSILPECQEEDVYIVPDLL
ncbi:uncharacterized protein LOC116699576 [Etheostoma spectabile]|uniref:Uncharacterized protein n=1 Tax=Etheostoma spectabile TaxID=54343 RepID=A0A5J5CYW2_9PERO|nr:uncharacterized protein LOC116699576 [Etheostoma spectabile]KAA8587688.1 hypothetical protein FQN60_016550 [Etheostoma spectabile]